MYVSSAWEIAASGVIILVECNASLWNNHFLIMHHALLELSLAPCDLSAESLINDWYERHQFLGNVIETDPTKSLIS